MNYIATCNCGTIQISAELPHAIETYQARQCDCDFCVAHGLAYLSDVDGTIAFAPRDEMNQLQQGSDQATFWQCKNCLQVVAVSHVKDGVMRGALSKALFEDDFELQTSITVSPKKLSAEQKSERWPTLWSRVV